MEEKKEERKEIVGDEILKNEKLERKRERKQIGIRKRQRRKGEEVRMLVFVEEK